MPQLNIPSYLDEKYTACLLVVVSEENMHQAWLIDDKVLCTEHIPCNYPSTTMAVYDNLDAYLEAIKDVAWLCESNAHKYRTKEVEEVIKYNDTI